MSASDNSLVAISLRDFQLRSKRQASDALQALPSGLLRATAHYVAASRSPGAAGMSGPTLALFVRPEPWTPLCCLVPGASVEQISVRK